MRKKIRRRFFRLQSVSSVKKIDKTLKAHKQSYFFFGKVSFHSQRFSLLFIPTAYEKKQKKHLGVTEHILYVSRLT